MGKKSAHTGMSPKDRSINIMDKFISRNAKRNANRPFESAIRKDASVPLHMWPLKDQIEFWANRTSSDQFNETYPAYSYWIADVQKQSKVHPTFFNDCAVKLKSLLSEMYDNKTAVKDAVNELRKHGVY